MCSSDLVANDVNGAQDVFLRDIPGILTPSPDGVDFGTLAVGVRSAPIPVTLSNTGWADLRIKGSQLAGTNAGDFTVQADTCAGSLLVRGKNCAVTLVYGPRAGGDRNGLLNVFNSTVRSPLSIKRHGLASDAKLVLSDKTGARGRVVTAKIGRAHV